MNYHFSVLVLLPEFDETEIEQPPFTVAKRLWQTSTFDLATLATRHKLHLPYQTMDVLLSACNLEIRVQDQESLDDAVNSFQAFRLMLYAEGVSPFLSPFIATHSINEYSGINSRDSPTLRRELQPGLQQGLTSESATIESVAFRNDVRVRNRRG